MMRTASEVLRSLEARIARLERRAAEVVLTPEIIENEYENAKKLSQVDPQIAAALIHAGDRSGDKIKSQNRTIAAAALKPSQTTMLPGNSLCMIVWMINNNKIDPNLGAIISNDNFIMDGHHRWAAMILLFGKAAKVGGIQVDLPGSQLVRVLNVVTKGLYSGRNGNAGSGDIGNFNPAYVAKMCREAVENGLPAGIGGKFGCKAEDVKSAFIKQFGDVEVAIRTLSENAKYITTTVPSWAPDRKDMPVLDADKGEVDLAAGMLSRGEVEVFPPFPEEQTVKIGSRRNFRRSY